MRALALAALIALGGCSWDPEQPNVTVHVNGIPTDPAAGIDHLNVTVTDSSNSPKQYRPTFQPGSLAGGSIDLAFTIATGAYTVTAVAADRTDATVKSGSGAGVVPAVTDLTITLQ